jgi:2-hydroxycyclohexanecarboxyl-CoA dehydrogenase
MQADQFAFESSRGPWSPSARSTALVTGAGRGIGRAVAEELAAADANVIAADTDLASAQETSS